MLIFCSKKRSFLVIFGQKTPKKPLKTPVFSCFLLFFVFFEQFIKVKIAKKRQKKVVFFVVKRRPQKMAQKRQKWPKNVKNGQKTSKMAIFGGGRGPKMRVQGGPTPRRGGPAGKNPKKGAFVIRRP
jgi:hypothetical protein